MSSLSQFAGGGGVPVGGTIIVPSGPISLVSSGQEYLRMGSIKTYSADYAQSISASPQLRVFGTQASTYGSAVSGSVASKIVYHDSKYFRFVPSGLGSAQYATTLALLSSSPNNVTGSGYINPTCYGGLDIGNGYIVCAAGDNQGPRYLQTGTVLTSVGGTFTTFAAPSAICYCGALGWLALSNLNGTSGSRAYIANVVPSGTWTVDTPTSISMGAAYAIAYNGTTIVVVGASSIATAGKIATATSVSGAFTDRTASAGITFGTTDSFIRVVWTGSRFIAMNNSYVISSSDGITWSRVNVGQETASVSPVNSSFGATSFGDMVTDGAGTVVLTASPSSFGATFLYISSDHGVTWGVAQPLAAYTAVLVSTGFKTINFANSKFIANTSGNVANFVDCGSLTTPDYVGMQYAYAQSTFVRIK